ncbi:hypothetical protein SRB5_04930 [Streptomyces sp. RB5]|uniref:Tetracyclin repressor-like C-terminal group 31 domain-containing protein n=1 Tax=Streptomyces smaragdinus TaxID=2585196 RepID=A0A7K0CAB0_9ACTN|nr:TetR/AcrR family transcriptional regulator [Streptomyces smaragdinus]MQY10385.1 hypothetical protein [Streptomyces smaragdinus]
MSTPSTPTRRDVVGDAALRLLAERGMRGLTHRAVDESAGLPPGSTSNVARTRAALLELAVLRAAEGDTAAMPAGVPPDPAAGADALVEPLAGLLHDFLTHRRTLLLARYELALEATRRPELRAVYDRSGRAFADPLRAFLTAAGSPDPERHTRSLIAWLDGMLFSSTAGTYASQPLGREELAADVRDLLTGMLRP